MQKSISNRKTWLWLISILLVFIVVSYLVTSPEPEDYPNYVTESPAPTGVKGLYTYLDSTDRWSARPQLLLKEQVGSQLLIMVQPLFIPSSRQMEAYREFMKSGNTILLLQSNPDGMFDLQTTYIEEEPPASVYNQAGKKFRANMSSPIRLQTSEQDVVLLHDELGTIAFKRDYGRGQLIVANTPEWVTNENLLKKDHLPLVLSLISKGRQQGSNILFDAYIHGEENSSTILTLYPKWLLVMAIQLVILTIIFLWYQGKRFGPILVAREETVRFSDERIQALAAWYHRSRSYHDSIVIQSDYLKLLMQERFGIPYYKQWVDITEQLEKKLPHLPNTEIKSFLNGLTELLIKEKISKHTYVIWSAKLDRMRKEVDRDEERINILTK
ncbi:DUF4350 domain-containing protein [Virgibacillus sp. DJP39]|uniref:DUF4350 domain-containing protein n=1 Tax=Virgibacillus sp. DJP39 TaxID=3409790 RepID=UPI003BB6F618